MERDKKITDNLTLNDKEESSWADSDAIISAADISKDIPNIVENTEVYSTEGRVITSF